MAAAEDDWAKFMKELQTDLSKLPEQDFANASSLKEAVEVQVELKMAEDALTKKSVDIAVPLEQLGYERAEELVTNIEKWLPDTPDREKWSQEESLTDKDKEAPMAELPGELEDMIGDLMEQEEDLFDEMEDVSSSAADSLDKGAGWDALDGPISNMSAKGVTGNRLPNSSEIGGRSGEGRQGKSSGEFVGDEAVGKGGRKTPSRLTPDPVVKGQIKDHSKDSVGGATGGGKESGQGGEGLEGPLPRSPGKRDLRAPRRQASRAPQQGRVGRSPIPNPQLPSDRPQEAHRNHVPGRIGLKSRPLSKRPASAPGAPRKDGQRQAISRRRIPSPPRRHLQPPRRHPKRNSQLHARPLAARLGRIESAVF